MPKGILICGLNGAGKSTLGKVIAKRIDYHFIDNEDLYFPKSDPEYIYSSPRTREEVTELLFQEIKNHENFVFTSVKGDYGEAFYPFLQYAVLIQVPKDIRMKRIRDRSFQKFGDRMLSGGDLFEREESFFSFAESRAEDTVEEWIKALDCPIIRIDGTKSIDENADYIIERIQK